MASVVFPLPDSPTSASVSPGREIEAHIVESDVMELLLPQFALRISLVEAGAPPARMWMWTSQRLNSWSSYLKHRTDLGGIYLDQVGPL